MVLRIISSLTLYTAKAMGRPGINCGSKTLPDLLWLNMLDENVSEMNEFLELSVQEYVWKLMLKILSRLD